MRLLVMVGAMAALAACEPDMPTAPDPVGPGGREVTALGEADAEQRLLERGPGGGQIGALLEA